MKQFYKLLILFVFVYVTFAFGKELYTQDQDASATLAKDTTALTDVPLIEGAAQFDACLQDHILEPLTHEQYAYLMSKQS